MFLLGKLNSFFLDWFPVVNNPPHHRNKVRISPPCAVFLARATKPWVFVRPIMTQLTEEMILFVPLSRSHPAQIIFGLFTKGGVEDKNLG